jgi:hypothetical protein
MGNTSAIIRWEVLMYEREIFGTLLYLSLIVSFFFFAFLFVHSLTEERRQDAARQVRPPKPSASHVRQPAQVPSPPLATSLATDLAKD